MRKLSVVVFIFCLMLSLSAYGEDSYVQASVNKAKQGFTNIITGWLEVPYQIVKGYRGGWGQKEKNKILGGTFGIFRGVIHGVGRTADGAYELVTFALPNPKNNEGVGIPLDSRNVWEDGTQYSLANNGVAPVGRKVTRGVINAAFGIFDLPGQVGKGFSQDKPFQGLAKAIIYPLGRITSGVYDVVTFFLPNDSEGFGYPLSEKYPWDGFDKKSWDSGL
ncbi:MAG: exosortase system-associated protein, TIGR04073 family [Candidatus Omnitrophota bacterium]